MNGTQYAQKRFTLPASVNTSQKRWDLVFLPPQEFIAKYGCVCDEEGIGVCYLHAEK